MEQILGMIPKRLRAPLEAMRVHVRNAVSSLTSQKYLRFSWPYEVSHSVVCDKDGHGLAGLLCCQSVTMKTVRQRKRVSQNGEISYATFFWYEGKTFHGGSKKPIKHGTVISVEFTVGNKPHEFRLIDIDEKLPSRVFIFWEKKTGPGTIVPAHNS